MQGRVLPGVLALSMTRSGRPRQAPQLTLVGPRAPSDEALVHAHLAGDRAAFGALVQRHQRLVLALVRRYARSPEESADLVQQSFLRALAAAARVFPRMRLGEEGAFRAWLLRVAVNVGKNHARDGRRWRLEPVESMDLPAAESGITDRLEVEQRRRMVRAALDALTRRQREVFALRVDGELPFAEVARVLDITENNAKVHFHHAVRRLRERLGGEGER
ncbi:MAG TPA: sigma-70 family RNA polymerase sigma factor [Myxococcaceae bacterium]|nr:sigma-70 family RNA polymerase sigma factor [Myxococcaceae bacterium]